MIAVDTNILVYAHRQDSPFNKIAWDVLRGLAVGVRPWLIPFHCLVEFHQIVTHPRVYQPASATATAVAFVDKVIASPAVTIGHHTPSTWSRLRTLLLDAGITGPQTHDARIAAVCIDYAVSELWSADRNFSRFPQIKVVNPLIKS